MRKCERSLNQDFGSRADRSDHLFSPAVLHLIGVNSDFSLGATHMDRKRERYNARARQSLAGGASHKKRKRRNANGPVGGDSSGAPTAVIPDPNADIIGVKPLEQKELERRERVRQQVRALSSSMDALVIQYRPILPFLRWRSTRIRTLREKRKRN